MTPKAKISNVDAAASLALGAVARYGIPVGSVLLQLLAMAAGVFGVLALIWQRWMSGIALFPVAWVCWWFGTRLQAVARSRPLNQMLDQPPP